MYRVFLALSLLLLLMTSRVRAQALATFATVVVAMGAHLKREKGSPSEVHAAWDERTLVQGILTPKTGHTTSAAWELALTCAKGAGSAKALCQEVERR